MAIQYPSHFPCVLIDSYRIEVSSGVIRAEHPGQRQRRVFASMPHAIALSFAMPVSEWGAWYDWIRANAYSWFEMNLPSWYAGLAQSRMSLHMIRFTSGMSVDTLTEQHVRVSVSAELSPSMFVKYLEAT